MEKRRRRKKKKKKKKLKALDRKEEGSEAIQEVTEATENLEELKKDSEDHRQDHENQLRKLATLKQQSDFIQLLEGKRNNKATCGASTKKGTCKSKAKPQYGYFCGHHQNVPTSPAATDVISAIGATLVQIVTNEEEGIPKRLKDLEEKIEKERKETIKLQSRTDELWKQVKEKIKTATKLIQKIKGVREQRLFHILQERLGIRFTHRGGDFSTTGDQCRKILRNHVILLEAFEKEDDHEVVAKFQGLFSRLEEIVEDIYQISPFSVVTLTDEEIDILEGQETVPECYGDDDGGNGLDGNVDCGDGNDNRNDDNDEDSDDNRNDGDDDDDDDEDEDEDDEDGDPDFCDLPEKTELDRVIEKIRDLHRYFLTKFPDDPIPKQHFLVAHGTRFLRLWLSLGMFSEQAVESSHGNFNRLKRKYKSLGEKGRRYAFRVRNAGYGSGDQFKRKRRKTV